MTSLYDEFWSTHISTTNFLSKVAQIDELKASLHAGREDSKLMSFKLPKRKLLILPNYPVGHLVHIPGWLTVSYLPTAYMQRVQTDRRP